MTITHQQTSLQRENFVLECSTYMPKCIELFHLSCFAVTAQEDESLRQDKLVVREDQCLTLLHKAMIAKDGVCCNPACYQPLLTPEEQRLGVHEDYWYESL